MGSKKTVKEIRELKQQGKKITMLTAYDAAMARLQQSCGVDILLVGDSLGMVVLGYDSTVPVTMDEMLHHCKAVRRGAADGFIVGDMPFGSYGGEINEAVTNGVRFLKEGGCDAVKLEGGIEVCPTVGALVRSGIPVMGHIGLTPQTAGQMGGYKVQGRDLDSARKMIEEAKALEKAGVFAIVLECIPSQLSAIISESVEVATIGIGAGPDCDGQVLVINDLLGMFDKFVPRFVKQFANLAPDMKQAVQQYLDDVRQGRYPDGEHSFSASDDLRSLLKLQ